MLRFRSTPTSSWSFLVLPTAVLARKPVSARSAQVGLALNRNNVTRSLVLSRIDGHWKIGAVQSWLHTLSWQARPFYERLGYILIGEMPLGGGKHRRYFMRKDL